MCFEHLFKKVTGLECKRRQTDRQTDGTGRWLSPKTHLDLFTNGYQGNQNFKGSFILQAHDWKVKKTLSKTYCAGIEI